AHEPRLTAGEPGLAPVRVVRAPASPTSGGFPMSRSTQGRHRLSRRTKIATGGLALAIAVGGIVVATTTGNTGEASADEAHPAVRIDTGEKEKNEPAKVPDGDRAQADREGKTVQVACPDVASKLADIPDQAMAEVDGNLDQLDSQADEANQRIAATQGQGGPD